MRNEILWGEGGPFSWKWVVDLDKIQLVATTYWFVEVHAEFIMHKKYPKIFFK